MISPAGRGCFAGRFMPAGFGLPGRMRLLNSFARRGSGGRLRFITKSRTALNLSNFANDKFDAAACVLAIQNIHPLAPVFNSIARILKPGGRLVMVMMHPCFRGAKETSWGWDEAAKVQYRRIDRYLIPRKTPIVTHPGSNPDQYTWEFHRPISGYIKAMSQGGLLVDAMEEWASHKKSTSGPRAGAENVAREEIPLFLAIRAIKRQGQLNRTEHF